MTFYTIFFGLVAVICAFFSVWNSDSLFETWFDYGASENQPVIAARVRQFHDKVFDDICGAHFALWKQRPDARPESFFAILNINPNESPFLSSHDNNEKEASLAVDRAWARARGDIVGMYGGDVSKIFIDFDDKKQEAENTRGSSSWDLERPFIIHGLPYIPRNQLEKLERITLAAYVLQQPGHRAIYRDKFMPLFSRPGSADMIRRRWQELCGPRMDVLVQDLEADGRAERVLGHNGL